MFNPITLAFGNREGQTVWYNLVMSDELVYEEESYALRGAVFEVYKTLGNSYLEEVYQNALA